VRRRLPETLAAAAFDSFPPPSFCRREAARELHLEVSKMPMLFVVDSVHPVALATSPELPCRAAASYTRFAALAALGCFAVARVTFWYKERSKSSPLARNRGTPAKAPPLATGRRRWPAPAAAQRSHAFSAAGSRSSGPDLNLPPLSPADDPSRRI
jgi:hypothetical protein